MDTRKQYAILGCAAGFVFPIIAVTIQWLAANYPLNLSGLAQLHAQHVTLYVVYLAPLVLGLAGWRIGSARARLEASMRKLETQAVAYRRFYPAGFVPLLGYKDVRDVSVGDYREHKMTVLFSDIRGFTSMSESMQDRDVYEFLLGYYRAITPIITDNHGIIDKFIGDAVMGLFPASGPAAVRAAAELQKEMRLLNEFRRQGGAADIRVGVGLHAGDLVLGTIGDKTRMETTVLGDTVNISARLESLTKRYFVSVILSDTVYKGLPESDQAYCREFGRANIRGRSAQLTLYEYFAGDAERLRDSKLETKPDFLLALFHYQGGNYTEAHKLFADVQVRAPQDPLPVIFLNQCERALAGHKRTVRKKRRTALVVDDNPAMIRVLDALLEEAGWQTTGVATGTSALETYEHILPDLVLVDRDLSGENGARLVEQLRSLQSDLNVRVPIIGISAEEDALLRAEFMAAGLDQFLGKPFTPEGLRLVVERAMNGTPADGAPVASGIGGDQEETANAFDILIPGYLNSIEGRLTALRKFANSGELVAIKRIGHGLKGSGATYGIAEISEIGARLEKAAAAEHRNLVTLCIDELERTLSQARQRWMGTDSSDPTTAGE